MLILECGEIDLAHVLSSRVDEPFDAGFVRYHVTEIMKCVKAVHDMGIVHSDLKPANFLFVRGVLKLIDFGISNALTDKTMNVYRECQIGTPNYMAPETLIEANQYTMKLKQRTYNPNDPDNDDDNHNSTWKVGKPADIWACGCIIYQMVYGRPPYAAYQGGKKVLAITNPKIAIEYPKFNKVGSKIGGLVIELMRSCLYRDPKNRATADEVLMMDFLRPKLITRSYVNELVKQSVKYGWSHPKLSDAKLDNMGESIWNKIKGYE
ncbi:unnamed protein product [Ambrosiozyma monospora]|uniref:Unnamed protein product n=2 Tax=Ambrosiozyma monospora TaxID=43982 RepID=A0ACB5UBB7_AMBMO|nr:unnamed protein product [Ambrosiozyma monospora]